MSLKQFITQLNMDMGFEQALDVNDMDAYSLRFEPDIDISFKELPDASIMFQTSIAPLPQKNSEQFLLKTMIANLFGRETGGAILGLDKDGRTIVLLDFLPENINYRTFHDRLEDFVNYTQAWREEAESFASIQNEM